MPPAGQQHDPADRLHRLSDDVRHHHSGPDHRRVCQPGHVQGLHDLPDRVAAVRVFPLRPHGVGRRILAQWGVLDFAGGIVVHDIAGIAALASVLYVGRRRSWTAARTASRWSRSAPACSGSAGTASTPAANSSVDSVTAVAFLNTDIAASFAAVTWLVVEWMTSREAEVPRPAHRRRGGPGHDHAGRRLRFAHHRRHHRHRRRRGLLLCRGAEEQAAVGRRPGRLGRSRRGRVHRHRHARHLRQPRPSTPAGVNGLLTATPARTSSTCSAWPC